MPEDVQIQMHELYKNAIEQLMLYMIYPVARLADEADSSMRGAWVTSHG